MRSLGKTIAIGAVWMISMRLIERSIGFVSTLILARLLTPADFGLVAMAMVIFALIEIAGQFGFDFALIRQRDTTRSHYDSAWTISLCYGVIAGASLGLLAEPAAQFFGEPRLVPIIYILGAVAFIQGTENIGIVDFRKHFAFHKDFLFIFMKKVFSFAVTISAAFAFRSYWALVAGIVTSRLIGVALSYALHPFRPRISFAEARSLLTFSRWILLTRLTEYLGARGPDILIGRSLGASSLGFYTVGREVSTLPTSELIFPIMRAVFPGYAAIAHDRRQLARTFLNVQSIVVALALPAGIGIVVLADLAVAVLLGPQWASAVTVIQVLGLYGAVAVFQATNTSIFSVLGVPYLGTILKLAEVAILIPAVYLLLAAGYDIEGVSYAVLGAKLTTTPASIMLTAKLLNISFLDRLRVSWRPMAAVAVMATCLSLTMSAQIILSTPPFLILIGLIVVGAFTYSAAMIALWLIAGKPDGAERFLISAAFHSRRQ